VDSHFAEVAILGSVILDNAAWQQAAVLCDDDFALDSHRRIFRRQRDLADSGRPIDFVTLHEELVRNRELEAIGGDAYLTFLTDGLPRVQNIEHYVRIVRDKAALRQIAHAAEAIQQSACSPDADPAALAERLSEVADNAWESLCVCGAIRRLEDVPDVFSFNAGKISYLVPDLIPRGALVLLTGAPGIGKSSLALRLAIACAIGGEFLGRRCERVECLYLDKENPLPLVQQRMELLAGGPIPGLYLWGGWLKDEPPMIGDPRLPIIAAQNRPLIVFDSKVRFHTADENSASEMRIPMGHLRKLVDVGATVLVLHHRAKAEGSKYRGSTDILAAVDMAYTLEAADGFLRLRRFKSRFSAEQSIQLRADFATGSFEVIGAGGDPRKADGVELVRAYIAGHPGVNTRAICEALQGDGISRSRALEILHHETGRLWRMEYGDKTSHRYFPIDTKVSGVPGVPPKKAAEHRNTPRSERSASVPGTQEHAEGKRDSETKQEFRLCSGNTAIVGSEIVSGVVS
jgi:hypothetical protein